LFLPCLWKREKVTSRKKDIEIENSKANEKKNEGNSGKQIWVEVDIILIP